MIIKNKLLEIKTLEYSLENEYYNVKLNMKLANDITDTDFGFDFSKQIVCQAEPIKGCVIGADGMCRAVNPKDKQKK